MNNKLKTLRNLIGTSTQVTIKFDGGFAKCYVVSAQNESNCVFALDKSLSRTIVKPLGDVISLS